jgi:hypothetical protein
MAARHGSEVVDALTVMTLQPACQHRFVVAGASNSIDGGAFIQTQAGLLSES